MSNPEFDQTELLALLAEVQDGNLDEAGREALNTMLKASPEARRFYREHMELHARLHLDYTSGEVTQFLPGLNKPRKPSRFPIILMTGLAAAACVALLVTLARPRQLQETTRGFVTLESSSAARWQSSDLPTKDGTRLGKGTLRLVEGLVTLRFDSGAQVSLEAPVELTLVDAMRCTLGSGMAVAEVPDSAIGFQIATPAANVVDYGTRFSVMVDTASGLTHTRVYEGLVEVEHPPTGGVVALKAGQMNSTDKSKLGEVREGAEETTWPNSVGPAMRGPEWKVLETTKDAYTGRAIDKGVEVPRSDTLLLVKRSIKGYSDRKAYLGFDLAGIDPDRIEEAELTVHFEPTGLGLASDVPDATFSVHGLVVNQRWNENTLNAVNAPARRSGFMLDPEKVRHLGSFLVKQGVQSGKFGIQGEDLAAFLRENAGSQITLIVIRDTIETRVTGMVHGFASRRHPTLPPPTLAIRRAVAVE